jgi:hypothetical protein
MWMAEPMEGEVVGEIPTYAPAFKEVYRFILEAMDGKVSGRGDAREITFHLASVGEGGASGR